MHTYKKIPRYAVVSTVTGLTLSLPLLRILPRRVASGSLLLYKFGSLAAGISILLFLVMASFDFYRQRNARALKVVAGTRLVPPRRFNKEIRGDGIGIPCLMRGRTELLRIPADKERYHFLLAGDTGTGKSTILISLLQQLRERGDLVIIYDPSLQFFKTLAEPPDILLHPLSSSCPSWNICDEITNELDAKAVANSFLPDENESSASEIFFKEGARRIFRLLLLRLKAEGKGTDTLLQWLTDENIIDETVDQTPHAYLINSDAPGQRMAILGSLSKVAEALSLVPTIGTPFSFQQWYTKRQGWIFMGTQGQQERDALRPLISAWLDIAMGKLMLEEDAPAAWIFIDELPSLEKLPSLSTAVVEGRKYNLRFCIGIQGPSQLHRFYGKATEAILSSLTTKVFLRLSEHDTALWGANTIGKPRQQRSSHSYSESYGSPFQGTPHDSYSHRNDQIIEHLVIPNEIQNLPDRTGYLRYGDVVTRIAFDYHHLPQKNTFTKREERKVMPRVKVLTLPSPS